MNKILNSLFENNILSRCDAKDALRLITSGGATDAQIASFITVFLMRKITAVELGGFRDALLETGHALDLSDLNPMDVCGTGGDNKNTFNISTLCAFAVAGAGIPVAKHGNYAVSSSCGSSNIMEYLGYSFPTNQDDIKKQIKKTGITFLHAPLFQPALKHVGTIRKELRVKTFFNMLGPVIHPASPKKQLMGVYSPELATIYSTLLEQTDTDYVIVHSLDGFDEISLTGAYRIINRYDDKIIDPEEAGFKMVSEQSISGGNSVKESAEIFMKILQGGGTAEQNEVVVANAAAAIKCYRSGLSHEDSVEQARESLLSLKALTVFKKLIN